MDTTVKPGVYVWLKTTHLRGFHGEILESLVTALAGKSRHLQYGYRVGTGESASDHLVRSTFVVALDEEEFSERSASSPIGLTALADMQGAVNGATNDPDRSNCRPAILPYPPRGITWVMVGDDWNRTHNHKRGSSRSY